MRGFWASLSILNTLKCVELVQVFGSFTGKSEQFSYSPTIVDTHICAFFDGVLEKVLEKNMSVRHRRTPKTTQMMVKYCEQPQEIPSNGIKRNGCLGTNTGAFVCLLERIIDELFRSVGMTQQRTVFVRKA